VRHVPWTVRSRLAEHPGYVPIARRRHGEAVVSAKVDAERVNPSIPDRDALPQAPVGAGEPGPRVRACPHAELEGRAAGGAGPHPRPSAYKEGRKAALRAVDDAPAHAHLRRRAKALDATFAAEAGRGRLADPPS
jgi:hypothetical protein